MDSKLHATMAGPPSASPSSLGSGRYSVIGVLGEGAYGQVLRVRDEVWGGEVALKRLQAEDEEDLRAFKREFRDLFDVWHPGLVPLRELDKDEQGWFLTMDVVEGEPLQPGALRDPGQARAIATQLTEAVRALHGAGLVHADVKPSHVMVTQDGRVVLLDFGMAQRVDGQERARGFMGTPQYAAPEQLLGAAPSTAWDVWAIGATLFEAIEGRLPWDDQADPLSARMGLSEDGRVPRGAGPLGPWISAMLDPDPAQRPSLDEVAAGLGGAEAEPAVPVCARPEVLAEVDRVLSLPGSGDRMIQLYGPPGVGKSTLARLVGQRAPADLPVIRVRSVSSDRLPLRSLDAILDSVVAWDAPRAERVFRTLPSSTAAALSRRFPALRDVLPAHPGLAPAEASWTEAVGLLLREMGPLWLVFDGVESLDEASVSLLAEAFDLVAGAPVTVFAFAQEAASPVLEPLWRRVRADLRARIPIPPLSEEASGDLLRAWFSDLNPESVDRLGRLAGGSPLLLRLLGAAGDRVLEVDGDPWEVAVGALLEQERDDVRRALRVLSLEPEGATLGVWTQVAEVSPRVLTVALPRLLGLGLLGRDVGGEEVLAISHASIRRALWPVSEDRVALHRRWAGALGPGRERARFAHLVSGWQPEDAWTLAQEQLHTCWADQRWGLAAWWAEAAAQVAPNPDQSRQLWLQAVDALTLCGRAGVAARRLERMIPTVEPGVRDVLRVRVAALHLYAGHREEGIAWMDEALQAVGLHRPRWTVPAFVGLIWRTRRPQVRRLAWTPREEPLPDGLARRLETAFEASLGLSLTDPIASASLQVRAVQEALREGDPWHLTRLLSIHLVQTAGGAWDPDQVQKVEAALYAALEASGDPGLADLVASAVGTAAWMEGRLADGLAAMGPVRERQVGWQWIRDAFHVTRLSLLLMAGDLHHLGIEYAEALEEAEDRQDLHLKQNLELRFLPWLCLARGHLDQGLASLERSVAGLSGDGTHTLRYFYDLHVAMLRVARGEAVEAFDGLEAAWRGWRSTLFVQIHHHKVLGLQARARVAMAVLARDPAHRAAGRVLRACVRGLTRGPSLFAQATGRWIEMESRGERGEPSIGEALAELGMALDARVATTPVEEPLPGVADPSAWRSWFAPRRAWESPRGQAGRADQR